MILQASASPDIRQQLKDTLFIMIKPLVQDLPALIWPTSYLATEPGC